MTIAECNDIMQRPITKRKSEPMVTTTSAEPKKIAESPKLLAGYLRVAQPFWPLLPIGVHIYYGNADSLSSGYVKESRDADLLIGTSPGRPRPDDIRVDHSAISRLWKQYDRGSIIEIQLCSNSLAAKSLQIAEAAAKISKLEATVAEQEASIAALTDQLTQVKRILVSAIQQKSL